MCKGGIAIPGIIYIYIYIYIAQQLTNQIVCRYTVGAQVPERKVLGGSKINHKRAINPGF